MHGGALTLSYVIPTDESPSDAWYCFPEVCFQGMLLLSSKRPMKSPGKRVRMATCVNHRRGEV